MSSQIDRTNYNALVDDSGSNLDGTNWNKNQVKIVLLDQIDKLFDGSSVFSLGGALALGEYTTTATGTKNDWDIDTDNSGTTVGILRCNNATDLTITGFKAPSTRRLLYVFSIGAGNVILRHQNTSSTTAGDRLINFATSGDTLLAAGVGYAAYIYDVTTARWRLVQHEQGAWLTVPFAGGNFTTNGAGGVTVDSGDVGTQIYRLSGRTLQYNLLLSTVTVTAATGNEFRIALPSTFVGGGHRQQSGGAYIVDNGTQKTGGQWDVPASTGYVRIFIDSVPTNWTASTNNTYISFAANFEVA